MSTILSGPAQAVAPSAGFVSTTSDVSAASLTPAESLGRELHWTRPNGASCFSTAETRAVIAERRNRWNAAVRELGDPETTALFKAAADRTGKASNLFKGSPKPAAAYHSEVLRATVLRTDWSPSGVQLAVDWSNPEILCELVIGRDVVASGAMTSRVVIDGRERPVCQPWGEVCWISDDEGDCLELETSLDDGLRLQRQFTLLRRDGLLLIADAVLGQGLPNTGRGEIECEWTLPFAPSAKFFPADETRDLQISIARRTLTVLPTALPEWRSERADGEVTVANGAVKLRQSARQAVAMYAPLAMVVDSRRAKRECTWRRLTVGENLQIQPADRAVGYRLQAGREQWLVYRSLTPRANRTVLGVNLQTNFLCSRIKSDGASDTLIEVED